MCSNVKFTKCFVTLMLNASWDHASSSEVFTNAMDGTRNCISNSISTTYTVLVLTHCLICIVLYVCTLICINMLYVTSKM